MNTVTLRKPKDKYAWTGNVGDLVGSNFKNTKSAFFGNVGHTHDQLFLVTYMGIFRADDPQHTWNNSIAEINVIRFVDVNITIIGD